MDVLVAVIILCVIYLMFRIGMLTIEAQKEMIEMENEHEEWKG